MLQARCAHLWLAVHGVIGCFIPGECDIVSYDVEPGDTVDGVAPYAVVDRHLGTSSAALRWEHSDQASLLRVDVLRDRPIAYVDGRDCRDPVTFAAGLRIEVASDDGLLGETFEVELRLDGQGNMQTLNGEPLTDGGNVVLTTSVDYAALRNAGVGDPNIIASADTRLELTIDGTTLEPVQASVVISSPIREIPACPCHLARAQF